MAGSWRCSTCSRHFPRDSAPPSDPNESEEFQHCAICDSKCWASKTKPNISVTLARSLFSHAEFERRFPEPEGEPELDAEDRAWVSRKVAETRAEVAALEALFNGNDQPKEASP